MLLGADIEILRQWPHLAATLTLSGSDTAALHMFQLTEFVKARVGRQNYPRIVRIVDDLPLGPTGKVLKRAIDLSFVG